MTIIRHYRHHCVDCDGQVSSRRHTSDHFDGRLAVIQMPRAVNWFHWLIQCLPKLKTLVDSGERFDAIHVGNMLPAARDSLECAVDYFGISRTKLLTVLSPITRVSADRLIVPDIAWHPSKGGPFPAWIRDFLCDVAKPSRREGYERIFLSRRGFAHYDLYRSVEHLFALTGVLRVINLHVMPFCEQAVAVASADLIVSPEGSALANLVFARPGARVIELFNVRNDSFMFAQMAHAAGCFHARIVV